MEKGEFLAVFQILILFIAIVSFADLVSADGESAFDGGVGGDKLATKGTDFYTQSGGSTAVSTNGATGANVVKDVTKVTPPVPPPATPEPTKGFLAKITKTPNSAFGGIAQGAAWGGAVYGAIKLVGPMVTEDEAMVNALSTSLGAGVFVGRSVANYLAMGHGAEGIAAVGETAATPGKLLTMSPGTAGFVTGGLVTVAIFLVMYKKTTTEVIQFSCQPWEAPTGGNRCEECNTQGDLPCSEYQCRSLGQSCQLINQGTSEESCAWLNRGDVTPPVITEWEDALSVDFTYEPGTFVSPGDRGARIVYDKSSDGCIPAYTPLSFGINADEPARCKIDYQRKANFSQMEFDFGGSNLYRYNHTQVLSLPGPDAAEEDSPILENDGEFELFIRCIDANGYGDPTNRVSGGEGVSNTASFVFQFCVDDGPDTTPPIIVTTDIISGMPIAYDTESTDIKLYTNEPATCRWSRIDQSYEDMEEPMVCSSNVLEMNAQMLYECYTTLSGLKNREENNFYFRCEDQPNIAENDRARNQQSYEFSLIGTQPLVLNEVGPNGTIKDSTDVIQITLEAKTSAGYDEGLATCYYSEDGETDSYIAFYTTGNANGEHEQDLYLAEGAYSYFIKCIDLGGNSDMEEVSFIVESDGDTPLISRAYKEETYLKLITSEPSECVYSNDDCNYLFDDGQKMTVVDENEHFTNWDTKANYYIKCQDEFQNQPEPNECSMVIRAIEDFEQE